MLIVSGFTNSVGECWLNSEEIVKLNLLNLEVNLKFVV
jgi:hypothetical protein